jgi:hypothetical protein
MSNPELDPPKSTGGDTAHMLVKAAISAVPLAGGPGAEFFGHLVAAPLERRRHEWMERVGSVLREVTQRVAGLEDSLRESPDFVDLALKATQAAMRTSAESKHDALANALVNAAAGSEPDVELQQLFISFVDDLSPQQIQFLDFFEDPAAWTKRNARPLSRLSMGALSHVVEEAFPKLAGQRSLYDQLWRDLYARGLVTTESLHVMMTGQGLLSSRLSDTGKRFLRFIRRPAA